MTHVGDKGAGGRGRSPEDFGTQIDGDHSPKQRLAGGEEPFKTISILFSSPMSPLNLLCLVS